MKAVSHETHAMAAATDAGKVRKENEDYFYFSRRHKFFIVCDGMGGHSAGAVASKMAGATLHDALVRTDLFELDRICADLDPNLPEIARRLIGGARMANRRIFSHAQRGEKHRGMGTTLVAAAFHRGQIFLIHVGDSRIYRLRQGRLTCLTKDHSWLNELIEDKEISERQAKEFRSKNVLTRALGTSPRVKIDLRIDVATAGDLFLLCTDGLHNGLTDELIQSVLSAEHGSWQNTVDKLVHNAKLLDGSDNITAGLVSIQSDSIPALSAAPTIATIPEEPERVSAYIDRQLKSLYREQRQQKPFKFGRKWMVATTMMLFVLILAASFWPRSSSQPPEAANLPTALMEIGTAPGTPQKPLPAADAEPAGTLVLLQVHDPAALRLLHHLAGTKVLDEVQRFSENTSLSTGRYAWVLTDSHRNIVYKNDQLEISPPLEAVAGPQPSSAGPTAQEANARHIIAPQGQLSQHACKVYFIGDFSQPIFRESQIFIDDNLLGPLDRYLEDGFYLRPGTYDILIRSSEGQILKAKTAVKLRGGKVVPIEF